MTADHSKNSSGAAYFRRFQPPGRAEFWVFILATALSLVFSFVVYPRIQEGLHANVDPDRIGELTRNIYEGRGYVYTDGPAFYPAMNRGPAYPYFVVLLYLLTGSESLISIQIAQAILHGLLCVVILVLGRRIFDVPTAILASILCAIHPMLLWYTSRVWVETFLALLVALVALGTQLIIERPTAWRGILTGAAIGLATLTKAVMLPFAFLVVIYVVFRRIRGHLRYALLMLAVSVVIVVPWTIRNYSVSGAFVGVTTSVGVNMMQGDAVAHFWLDKPFQALELQSLGQPAIDSVLAGTGQTMTDPAGDRRLAFASFSYNVSHPLFLLKRIFINGMTFWYLSESLPKSIFLLVIQLPLLVFVCLFLKWNLRHFPDANSSILLLGYYFLAHVLIIGWARYSMPIISLCIVLASYFIIHYRGWRQSRFVGFLRGMS